MPSLVKVVVLSTAWGPAHGGVNSFNADLCTALVKIGCAVTCVVLDATQSEIADAQRHGVQLLPLHEQGEAFPKELASKVQHALQAAAFTPDLWIGHDTLTGPAMIASHGAFGSKAPRAVLHHMHYLSYKTIESSAQEADEKNRLQRETLSQADIVFAVGPKLVSTAKDSVRHRGQRAPRVCEVIPGLPQYEALDAPNQFRLFFAGRLAGKTGKLKQVKLAVAAFGRAVATYGADLRADPILTLLGADQSEASTQTLRQLAQYHARRHVTLLTSPFTTNRDQLLTQLSEQTAAMLLSIHEGFGLTAWEAIGTSIPLIISTNSGVYEFLDRELGGPARGCLHPVEIKASLDADIPSEDDIAAVVESIARIARAPTKSRNDARKLRAQLTAYTWENTALTILRECGLHALAQQSPESKITTPAVDSINNTPDAGSHEKPPHHEAPPLRTILFDIYEPQCKPYYIDRYIDTQLHPLDYNYHLWLWGATGTGKTTTLRHRLMADSNYQYVSLASCIDLSVPQILEHLLLEISERLGHPPAQPQGLPTNVTISRLARLLTRTSTPPLVIHIDEVPIDQPGSHRDFSKAIAALFIEHAGLAPTHPTRYAISTFDAPNSHIGQTQARVRERLAVFEVTRWNQEDLVRLLETTASSLHLALSPTQRETLLARAQGSPRFVKGCLRKLVMLSTTPTWNFERILNETAAETVS